MQKNAVVAWFTGLSGAGKSTLAQKLACHLQSNGFTTLTLDGDQIRNQYHVHLSFSKEDIIENNRLIAELCRNNSLKYDVIIVPIISPYAVSRSSARDIIGHSFYEIYIHASKEELVRRDTKGFYKKNLAGQMDSLIGFSETNPYEAPQNPDFSINTEQETPDQSAERLCNFICSKLANRLNCKPESTREKKQ